jgi:hypothetical protein
MTSSPSPVAVQPRNAKAEAEAMAGAEPSPRVLEPSPPAVADGPFFADDPVAADPHGDGSAASAILMPAGMTGESDWSTWAADDPERQAWVAERWLGGPRRLPPTPAAADLTATRIDLHRLAAYVVAPVRHKANAKFGLRSTFGGFGTPFFVDADGRDRQVRVEADARGGRLIDQRGDTATAIDLTTLRAAAEFLGSEIRSDAGAEHDSPDVGDVEAALTTDPASVAFLGQWFAMAFAALELVRADDSSVDPSRPQLWPGHFDPAIEVGDEDHRASYGASPGDPSIDEPYLYASLWWPDRIAVDQSDPFWNAPSFTGAVLKLSDFPAEVDPVDVAANFWLSARDKSGG